MATMPDMKNPKFWYMIFDRFITKEELTAALQKIFRLNLSQINTVTMDDISTPGFTYKYEDAPITCLIQYSKGGFPSEIDFYFSKDFKNPFGFLDLCRKLNLEMDTRCLIDDDSINPYTYLLVQNSQVYVVWLEVAAADAKEPEVNIEKIIGVYQINESDTTNT